ncbi:CYTH domain-containing protein [Paenibacillus lutimineralis]|uniref:CYTH domain-containing protein n=1 Tax=Paenibacillus lutimineralis TaxID=2707005 RepID=A0A3Q9I6R4_9BACL|nr:CYTH domain-containing protein [Paenibacillus lutimineralis]AZS13924.1 CYTH domain-containing protein [Paenibacillus lutimineralis]
MSLEIERKFLLPEYPANRIKEGEIRNKKEQIIEQTYLALHGDQELRVRKIQDQASGKVEYTHTFKKGHGIAREEVEYSISEGLYEQIMNIHQAVPLIKKRTTAIWGDRVIEIDDYKQIQLLVLEVEFASLEEAESFAAPGWFGKDISSDKQYSNKKVWQELQARKG